MPNMDSCLYKAAICPRQKVESSQLQQNINCSTAGGQNTLLHLASAAGNLQFIQKLLLLDLEAGFVEAVNANGNIALHEAAQRGHYEVVELLLHHGSRVDRRNKANQTPLFKACEGGHLGTVTKLLEADESKMLLLDKSSDGRNCLHVVVSRGDADMLDYLLSYIQKNLEHERGKNALKDKDKQGNTVLHLAVIRNRLDMVQRILEFVKRFPKSEPLYDLFYSQNTEKETVICVAVKLGFLAVVEELVSFSPDSIEITSKNGKNILHLAVELSQVKILKLLVEKVDISQLINQPDETQAQEDGNQRGGDTPLHIAATNKNVYMVDVLLKVPGVNKNAVNGAGLTPLDIARENTEYHEPYKIIEKLSAYPSGHRPFLYSAPTMSLRKKKKAEEILDGMFNNRRNVELVVATLLATMTFTAVFTVPGGFKTESSKTESSVPAMPPRTAPSVPAMPPETDSSVLGMPVLIGYDSFKLFLVFDCLAFFLSLFVVLMWEMSTPLTDRDKMLFIYLTNLAVCSAFAFTAFSLMAAVYTVLVHKSMKFAAIVLGSSMLITLCGTGAFIYIAAKFTVRRARFHSLCGVPRSLDDIVEKWWVWAEKCGILDAVRRCDEFLHGLISGDIEVSREKGRGECGGRDKVPPTCQPPLEAERA